jgi:hypothetical protein
VGDLLQPWHLIVVGIILLFLFVPFWQIFKKAGYPPALSLLLLIPYVNLVVLLWFSFSDWPVLKELRRSRGENPQAS